MRRGMRRGFSLMEVMVAVLVVAMGVAIFAGMTPARTVIGKSRHYDLAATAAYREIEAWRAEGYKSAITGDTTDPYTRLAGVANGTAIVVPARSTVPTDLPHATVAVALRRIDSGQFNTTTPSPASPTANYPAVLGTSALTNFRCQIDVEVSWTGVGTDKGSVRITGLLVRDPVPSQ